MSTTYIPDREAQALREVGVTAVHRATAVAVTLLSVATFFWVALFEPLAERLDGRFVAGSDEPSPHVELFRELGSGVVGSLAQFSSVGLSGVNRALLDAIDRFEDRLEDESFLRRWLLPKIQWRLAIHLGVGNEQAYVGRDRWLFYRPDIEFVTGPGFLEPEVLKRRRRGGDAWREPPAPDPLPALEGFHSELEGRGIRLVVLPTPVKPTVQPKNFTAAAEEVVGAIQNSSFAEFVSRLRAGGIDVVDAAPLLAAAGIDSGEPQYLRTDTHWTPQAVDRVALALARHLEGIGTLGSAADIDYRRRRVALVGRGDIAAMLLVPEGQVSVPDERLTAEMVLRPDGRVWRPQRNAPVLLLGDSFSNIYSDPTLGWGAGAGLAEQLSFHLRRPVDKLALNAGGALATRQVLKRTLASGEDRLAGKRVVVYQFATRELTTGDWQVLSLAPGGG